MSADICVDIYTDVYADIYADISTAIDIRNGAISSQSRFHIFPNS